MFSKIRTKLVVFFIALILAMSVVNYLVYLQYSSFVHNLKSLDNIMEDINKTQSDLANDIVLTRFVPRSFDSQVSSNKLINDIDSALYLNLMDPSEYATYRSIQEMVKSYTDEATKAVHAKTGRNPEKSLMHFKNSEKIAGYMKERINYLVSSYRVGLVQKMQNQYIIVITLFATAFISLFFSIAFSGRITRHIKNLTKVAQIVSKGKFDIEEIPITGKDEISILTSAFNKMISNIKKLISEIKEKAEVEKKLKQKEVENLEISNLLKEAELRALQSQINPHFLFNTLGCVAHTALKEEADKTYDLIMSVADLFRYNLSRSHRYGTLRDEINNIKEYIHIQKARFKDKFEFEIQVEDDSLLDITIPCLSIQPIVENSFLHGIEKKEGHGVIKISIFKAKKDIVVEIWDTGVGISEKRIQEIISDDPLPDSITSAAGHTTSLGLKNVIKRLKLFYQRSDVIEIKSKVGESTSVILYLPAEME
ncbi:sensor histidine kinase [Pseudobacteroides cellulosolvens]|uniref:Integral membrane sensor signal transduction histidine kinase n=1 Tax=Pseudobacteroides cellulosolvens ATCC 35603 = DSM 2933 TaxID=398512 RepID=A0A0L6JXS3_9FIRM|nr:sensor histidine kinase [Pseudobacteroides cellulosolvens]KNY30227.1 integral membrane sensor signal transduction histidine kinase [Pseudobacteroides cellulosolvens ATCC 35603 = DSM 2933]